MRSAQPRRARRRFIGTDRLHKASLLLGHCGRSGEEVADPWYTDDFDATWDDVEQGLSGLIDEIEGGMETDEG